MTAFSMVGTIYKPLFIPYFLPAGQRVRCDPIRGLYGNSLASIFFIPHR